MSRLTFALISLVPEDTTSLNNSFQSLFPFGDPKPPEMNGTQVSDVFVSLDVVLKDDRREHLHKVKGELSLAEHKGSFRHYCFQKRSGSSSISESSLPSAPIAILLQRDPSTRLSKVLHRGMQLAEYFVLVDLRGESAAKRPEWVGTASLVMAAAVVSHAPLLVACRTEDEFRAYQALAEERADLRGVVMRWLPLLTVEKGGQALGVGRTVASLLAGLSAYCPPRRYFEEAEAEAIGEEDLKWEADADTGALRVGRSDTVNKRACEALTGEAANDCPPWLLSPLVRDHAVRCALPLRLTLVRCFEERAAYLCHVTQGILRIGDELISRGPFTDSVESVRDIRCYPDTVTLAVAGQFVTIRGQTASNTHESALKMMVFEGISEGSVVCKATSSSSWRSLILPVWLATLRPYQHSHALKGLGTLLVRDGALMLSSACVGSEVDTGRCRLDLTNYDSQQAPLSNHLHCLSSTPKRNTELALHVFCDPPDSHSFAIYEVIHKVPSIINTALALRSVGLTKDNGIPEEVLHSLDALTHHEAISGKNNEAHSDCFSLIQKALNLNHRAASTRALLCTCDSYSENGHSRACDRRHWFARHRDLWLRFVDSWTCEVPFEWLLRINLIEKSKAQRIGRITTETVSPLGLLTQFCEEESGGTCKVLGSILSWLLPTDLSLWYLTRPSKQIMHKFNFFGSKCPRYVSCPRAKLQHIVLSMCVHSQQRAFCMLIVALARAKETWNLVSQNLNDMKEFNQPILAEESVTDVGAGAKSDFMLRWKNVPLANIEVGDLESRHFPNLWTESVFYLTLVKGFETLVRSRACGRGGRGAGFACGQLQQLFDSTHVSDEKFSFEWFSLPNVCKALVANQGRIKADFIFLYACLATRTPANFEWRFSTEQMIQLTRWASSCKLSISFDRSEADQTGNTYILKRPVDLEAVFITPKCLATMYLFAHACEATRRSNEKKRFGGVVNIETRSHYLVSPVIMFTIASFLNEPCDLLELLFF